MILAAEPSIWQAALFQLHTRGIPGCLPEVIDYILAGDCYQVNLTHRFVADCNGDPYTAFTRLQTIAKAPFAAFMEDGDQAVLSFSPERFIQVQNRKVMTQPIKGTRPRNQTRIRMKKIK